MNDGVSRTLQLPTTSGEMFAWNVADVGRLLQMFTEESSGYAGLLRERLRMRPCTQQSPWRLVFYCDEVTPGNVLRPETNRKFAAFYMSFAELGPGFLGA